MTRGVQDFERNVGGQQGLNWEADDSGSDSLGFVFFPEGGAYSKILGSKYQK